MATASKPRRGYRTCTKCGTNRQERFFKPKGRVCSHCQRKRTTLASRDVRIQETYGITQADYERMLAAQGGGCAICGGKRRGNLDIDHCHKTGRVRGLLCRRCNRRLLPAAQDRTDRLDSAIDYLNNPPAIDVIGERVVPGHVTTTS